MTERFLLAALGLVLLGGSARADVAFYDDFDNPATVGPGVSAAWSGPGIIIGVQGYSGLGPAGNKFGGNFLVNGSNPPKASVLTLSNLEAHTSISLGFLLGIIDSWDGSGNQFGWGPDYLNITIDGVSIFHESFDSALDPAYYDPTYVPPPGVLLADRQYLHERPRDHFRDSAFNMGMDPTFQNIAHTASTLTIAWFASGAGWTGDFPFVDESFGLDNVRVRLNGTSVAVPEPSSVALCLAGGAWLLVSRRGLGRALRALVR